MYTTPSLFCLLSLTVVLGCSPTTKEDPVQLAATGSICLGMACTNPDGNTHAECGCGADYCVPNERTVEFAGLTPLTCIKSDCQPDDPDSCPTDYACLEIPTFAIDWLQTEKGIQMPAYLCVPDDEDTSTGPAPSTQDESWVTMSGGTYRMGAPDDEGPVVNLGPFDILKSEVTNGQYRYCVEQGQCTPPGRGNDCTGAELSTNLPINCVSWHQARALCQSLGGNLPSESQWEYAARSEGQLTYPWGEEPATCERVVMQGAGENACGRGSAQAVCELDLGLSAQGLCDMVGNLWEWTLDDYQADYAQIPTDGSPLVISGSTQKVSRGGAYAYDVQYQSVFYRNDHGEADFQVPTYGFRCARDSADR